MTSLSTVLHLQTLLWQKLLLGLKILLKKKELNTEEYITGLLEGYLYGHGGGRFVTFHYFWN